MIPSYSAGSSGYLRLRDVVKRVPVARSTIWQWVATGKFPPPVKLGKRVTAWPLASIERWEAERQPVKAA
jgi:prophage regulatory protein